MRKGALRERVYPMKTQGRKIMILFENLSFKKGACVFKRRKSLYRVVQAGSSANTEPPWKVFPYVLACRHSESPAAMLREDHATSPACCRNCPCGSGFAGTQNAATVGSSRPEARFHCKAGEARQNSLQVVLKRPVREALRVKPRPPEWRPEVLVLPGMQNIS